MAKPLFACNKCCHKLSYKGELCDKCHSGRGEQIYPVEKKKEDSPHVGMCAGARRKRKGRTRK